MLDLVLPVHLIFSILDAVKKCCIFGYIFSVNTTSNVLIGNEIFTYVHSEKSALLLQFVSLIFGATLLDVEYGGILGNITFPVFPAMIENKCVFLINDATEQCPPAAPAVV